MSVDSVIYRNIILYIVKESNVMSGPLSEIEVRLWPFKLVVRGAGAIAAIRWPLAAILTAIAVAILAGVLCEAYSVCFDVLGSIRRL